MYIIHIIKCIILTVAVLLLTSYNTALLLAGVPAIKCSSNFIIVRSDNLLFLGIIYLDYAFFLLSMPAPNFLTPDGFIIFDDTDFIHDATFDRQEKWIAAIETLRGQNLLQIDFIGTKAASSYITCTSIFMSRNFNFPKKRSVQPFSRNFRGSPEQDGDLS